MDDRWREQYKLNEAYNQALRSHHERLLRGEIGQAIHLFNLFIIYVLMILVALIIWSTRFPLFPYTALVQ